jgi:hypothetical protein
MYQPQFTFLDDVFLRVAALPFLVLHCAIVGLQAGYAPPLFLDFLPQGPPVLQFTQPLPLFLENQARRPPLVLLRFFATLLTADVIVCSANLAAAHNMPTAVSGVLRHCPRYLFVTGIFFGFFLSWH